MEKRLASPALRSLLDALRSQLARDRLSDEQGRRLLLKLESILRELARIDPRPN